MLNFLFRRRLFIFNAFDFIIAAVWAAIASSLNWSFGAIFWAGLLVGVLLSIVSILGENALEYENERRNLSK